MNCPRDSSTLARKTVEDTEIEVCPHCGGMFLEEGELNRIADPTPGDLEFSTVDLDTFEHEDGYGPIACPRDASPMGKVDFNVETGIILDYCRSCGGFWMDGKELIRINEEVKRLNDAAREVPDPPLIRLSQFFWNLPLPH